MTLWWLEEQHYLFNSLSSLSEVQQTRTTWGSIRLAIPFSCPDPCFHLLPSTISRPYSIKSSCHWKSIAPSSKLQTQRYQVSWMQSNKNFSQHFMFLLFSALFGKQKQDWGSKRLRTPEPGCRTPEAPESLLSARWNSRRRVCFSWCQWDCYKQSNL